MIGLKAVMANSFDIEKILESKKKQRVFEALSLSADRFVTEHGGNKDRVLNKLIDMYRAGEIYLNLEEIEKKVISDRGPLIVSPSGGAFKF